MSPSGIQSLVKPREAVLAGDLKVHRILPYRGGRMVGPFVFLDQMGPMRASPGHGGDVPPHPHIGLSTLTYLLDGMLLHRDSLGRVQPVLPREVNWMTAGRGVVHSERIPAEERSRGVTLDGLQAWVALPRALEESEPSFQHVGAGALPSFEVEGCSVRLIAGEAYGRVSPVRVHSRLFYFEVRIPAGRRLEFDPEGQEIACYLHSGRARMLGETLEAPVLPHFERGTRVVVEAETDVHGFFLGGAPFEEPRFIWWNFVSSSAERIEQAKRDWREGRFAEVPGETERVPLPESASAVARSMLP